jgi:hypothetical protein
VTALPVDQYSVLRTIEQAWHLPDLGKSRAALPITGIWRRAGARYALFTTTAQRRRNFAKR